MRTIFVSSLLLSDNSKTNVSLSGVQLTHRDNQHCGCRQTRLDVFGSIPRKTVVSCRGPRDAGGVIAYLYTVPAQAQGCEMDTSSAPMRCTCFYGLNFVLLCRTSRTHPFREPMRTPDCDAAVEISHLQSLYCTPVGELSLIHI